MRRLLAWVYGHFHRLPRPSSDLTRRREFTEIAERRHSLEDEVRLLRRGR